jgi:hypothetical protein
MKYGIGAMVAINKPFFWKRGWHLSMKETQKGFIFIAALLWVTVWISTPPLHWMLFDNLKGEGKNDKSDGTDTCGHE